MNDKKVAARAATKDSQARVDMYVAAEKWSTIRLGIVEVSYTICLIVLVIGAVMAIQALAGKTTSAGFFFEFFGSDKVSGTLGTAAGAGGLIWGHRERRARKKVIEEKHKRIVQLERMIDPKRSSAELSSEGDTLPENM